MARDWKVAEVNENLAKVYKLGVIFYKFVLLQIDLTLKQICIKKYFLVNVTPTGVLQPKFRNKQPKARLKLSQEKFSADCISIGARILNENFHDLISQIGTSA